ncbi:MAG: regulatory protein [Bacteriophage sp.]|nr:MAG: regulatory protein [Bacteriophage sp.]
MEELVIMKENKAVTTSLKVAEIFGKNHRDVMRTIRGLRKNAHTKQMFVESTFVNPQNHQEYQMYYMNRDGFTLLVMGFNGDKALEFKIKYIEAFNKMEEFIKKQPQFAVPQTFGEALQLAADQQMLIEKQKPKVEYYDEQMRNPGLMTVTEIAKDFGLSAAKLNQFLAKKHIQYKQGKHWVLYQEYADQGFAQYEVFAYAEHTIHGEKQKVHNNLKWTQKGRKFIYDLLSEEGIHPTIMIEN